MFPTSFSFFFFFFNDTATTEIYTLSLHDALPIFDRPFREEWRHRPRAARLPSRRGPPLRRATAARSRSEEHTSELQSPCNLVCRLLLEKKKKIDNNVINSQVQHTSHLHTRHEMIC